MLGSWSWKDERSGRLRRPCLVRGTSSSRAAAASGIPVPRLLGSPGHVPRAGLTGAKLFGYPSRRVDDVLGRGLEALTAPLVAILGGHESRPMLGRNMARRKSVEEARP